MEPQVCWEKVQLHQPQQANLSPGPEGAAGRPRPLTTPAPPDRLTSDLMGTQLISAANHVPELGNVAPDQLEG